MVKKNWEGGRERGSESRKAVAYPVGFLVAWKPPPAKIFLKIRVLIQYWHRPSPATFASFGNPPETNSGYATGRVRGRYREVRRERDEARQGGEGREGGRLQSVHAKS